MDSHYHQLCAEERACIMQMTHQGLACGHRRRVATRAQLNQPRDSRRNTIAVATVPYDAAAAGRQARQRLRQPRRPSQAASPLGSLHRRHRPAASRLVATTDCSRLRERYPDDPNYHVSHETIYATIYATPRGELRKDLIRCLRQGS